MSHVIDIFSYRGIQIQSLSGLFSCETIKMAESSSRNEPGERKNENESESGAKYECNICFEQASDAVVSMCGHLFW